MLLKIGQRLRVVRMGIQIQRSVHAGKAIKHHLLHQLLPGKLICTTGRTPLIFLIHPGGSIPLGICLLHLSAGTAAHVHLGICGISSHLHLRISGISTHLRLLAGHPVTVIPNPINTNLFKPHNKAAAREKCRLPQDKMLMLFGSVKITDKRKGIDYLVESCRLLAERHPELKEKLGVVTFGKYSQQLKDMLPFRVYPLDFVRDDHRLVDIYNAVDIFVTPSLEDNLPNTVMEAMACGTPCVGFNTGGIPEMIDHLHNGYVAAYKSAEDFANGIYWTLTDPGYPSLAEQACRKAVAYYSENTVARRFIELYNKL